MKFNISMKKSFYERLKEQSNLKGMGVSEYIRFALMKLWGDV